MHEKFFDHGARGQFRGDFSRDSYDPLKNFSRVLMQQGRVQLDADWNEQVSIFWHYMRALARHIGGEHWGPWGDSDRGFDITPTDDNKNLQITEGCYYVQGVLCENAIKELYTKQEGYPFFDSLEIDSVLHSDRHDAEYLVYLDVWERHLIYVEDDYIREVALGGPDTAARSMIVWQVKLKEIEENKGVNFKVNYEKFKEEIKDYRKPGLGRLRARARKNGDGDEAPCLVPPESSYRGAENQLYRVEIHNEGTAEDATFKWSRENGAVIFPIKEIDKTDGTSVTLEHLGRDVRFSLSPDDWVEIIDDDYTLKGIAHPLLQVDTIDPEKMEVTLKKAPELDLNGILDRHPYLRRWDHTADTADGIPVVENSGEEENDWIKLEDGLQIQFPAVNESQAPLYKTGDYWIIPARTATGDVQWPKEKDSWGKLVPKKLHPHGVQHYYAPLAVVTKGAEGNIKTPKDMRRSLHKPWIEPQALKK